MRIARVGLYFVLCGGFIGVGIHSASVPIIAFVALGGVLFFGGEW